MVAGNPQNTSPSKGSGGASESSPSKKKAAEKKANSGSSKKMTQKEQSERFIEAARKHDADESGKPFERLVESLFENTKR